MSSLHLLLQQMIKGRSTVMLRWCFTPMALRIHLHPLARFCGTTPTKCLQRRTIRVHFCQAATLLNPGKDFMRHIIGFTCLTGCMVNQVLQLSNVCFCFGAENSIMIRQYIILPEKSTCKATPLQLNINPMFCSKNELLLSSYAQRFLQLYAPRLRYLNLSNNCCACKLHPCCK